MVSDQSHYGTASRTGCPMDHTSIMRHKGRVGLSENVLLGRSEEDHLHLQGTGEVSHKLKYISYRFFKKKTSTCNLL